MKMLEETEWQDNCGNNYKFESEAYSCKVTIKITRPNMVLIGNEVEYNLDMTGDGHIVRKHCFSGKVIFVQRKPTIKVKHFTVIGITNLLGEPVCCIVIIEVREKMFDLWDVIDFSKEKVGYESDGEE